MHKALFVDVDQRLKYFFEDLRYLFLRISLFQVLLNVFTFNIWHDNVNVVFIFEVVIHFWDIFMI
jgi:hypothetical protein